MIIKQSRRTISSTSLASAAASSLPTVGSSASAISRCSCMLRSQSSTYLGTHALIIIHGLIWHIMKSSISHGLLSRMLMIDGPHLRRNTKAFVTADALV